MTKMIITNEMEKRTHWENAAGGPFCGHFDVGRTISDRDEITDEIVEVDCKDCLSKEIG